LADGTQKVRVFVHQDPMMAQGHDDKSHSYQERKYHSDDW
jgi:hypothetical protein